MATAAESTENRIPDGTVSLPRTFIIASRASQLAKIQTYIVRDALEAAHPSEAFGLSFMTTGGDKNQAQALYLLGGKALWTEELEDALLKGEVDIIVHSLKDVPTTLPDRCEIGAILEREDPRDSLVVKAGLNYKTLDDLPEGSIVGTSSVRRVAQLKRAFPKLAFADVRGNLNTRLAKLDNPDGSYTALILARAGLVRLGMGDRITSDITPPSLYHAVGQGALGIEIRSDDVEVKNLLKTVAHRETELRCLAERACLRLLEGGCSVPVGVESALEGGSTLTLTGSVTSLGGETHIVQTLSSPVSSVAEAEALGERVAQSLIDNGARSILNEIGKDREAKNKIEDEKKAQVAVTTESSSSGAQDPGLVAAFDPLSISAPPAVPHILEFLATPTSPPHTETDTEIEVQHPLVEERSVDVREILAKVEAPIVDNTPPPQTYFPPSQDQSAPRRSTSRSLPGAWPDDEEV